ncbi:MAG TPA: glutathione peroxidase [Sphingomonas sp.]
MTSAYDFTADRLDGTPQPLAEYRGRALLIVNTASRCGFTPQYAGLEALHEDYADKGLAILGFPCNQFGAQEPGDAEEIASFCSLTYDVRFPMFARVEVNGQGAHPLYRYLKGEARGLFGTRRIKWNFTKFLVGRDGGVLRRFAPTVKPEALRPAIEALLQAPCSPILGEPGFSAMNPDTSVV